MTTKKQPTITLNEADLRRLHRYRRARQRLVEVERAGTDDEIDNAELLVDCASWNFARHLDRRMKP
jgi:hypothetical protein